MKSKIERVRGRYEGKNDEEIILELDDRLAQAHRQRNEAIELLREEKLKSDELKSTLHLMYGHVLLIVRGITERIREQNHELIQELENGAHSK